MEPDETKESIALAIIAGDDALVDGLPRMLKSVVGKVDGVYVTFTGTSQSVFEAIGLQLTELATQHGIGFGFNRIPWTDSFADARNSSFRFALANAAPDGEPYKWITWLDCDDVLPVATDLRAAAGELRRRGAHGALINYDYKIDGDTVLTSHYKERLFRADYAWKWVYPIHENCYGPMGTRIVRLDATKYTVSHLRGPEGKKTDRNKRMIQAWYKADRETEPRAVMYMAHQTLAMAERAAEPADKDALLKHAIKLYREYMQTTPPDDDSFIVNNLCADILRQLGRFEDSINIDLQGVKMRPQWPTSYVSIAQTHLAAGGYDEAVQWSKMALKLSFDADQLQIDDKLEADYKPYMIIGAARANQKRYQDAYDAYEKAAAIYSDDFTESRLALVKKAMRPDRHAPKRTAKELHDMRAGDRPEKSIAFFSNPSIENWNPDLLIEGGLGGTETSIIKLSEELARNGWRVVVYGNPGDWDGTIRNYKTGGGSVEWYLNSYFHPDNEFTVFVGLRSPDIMDTPVKAKLKVLWLHDLTVGDTRYGDFGDRFDAADVIVCPTMFHLRHIMKVYAQDDPWSASSNVILNGIDRAQFRFRPERPERDPKRVVYASSPDRGLTRLLELWPDIAAAEPDASLDIYYGWESIDAIIARGLPTAPQLAYFKQETMKTIAKLVADGYKVAFHGRINQDELAYEFKRSGVMAYPANFQETFGIVFAQALTAGVLPVICELGAIGQMSDMMRIVPGPPDSMAFGPRFVAAVVNAMQMDEDDREYLPQYTANMDWPKVANGWEEMINNTLERQVESEVSA